MNCPKTLLPTKETVKKALFTNSPDYITQVHGFTALPQSNELT